MKKLGCNLVFLGIGGLLLPLFGLQFKILNAMSGSDMPIWQIALLLIAGGIVLLFITSLAEQGSAVQPIENFIANSGERDLSAFSKSEDSVNEASSGDALERFIQKIESINLEKPAEFYLKNGLISLEKFEFDDAILEFVKVIRVSAPQDKTYQTAKKNLIELGFSESDINHISK